MNSSVPLGLFLGPLVAGSARDSYGFPLLMALDVVLMVGVIIILTTGYHDSFIARKKNHLLKWYVKELPS